MAVDGGEHEGAVASQLALDLQIRNRDGQVQAGRPAAMGSGDVIGMCAPPDHEPRGQVQRQQRAHDILLLAAHHRDADFQLRHAHVHQRPGDGELFLESERHPRGLLAVAQGRVLDDRWRHDGAPRELKTPAFTPQRNFDARAAQTSQPTEQK